MAIDTENKIKMRLNRNIVHDNMNKVPYYNPNYAWNESPIGRYDCSDFPGCKTEVDSFLKDYPNLIQSDCPWECRYGKSTQGEFNKVVHIMCHFCLGIQLTSLVTQHRLHN